MAEGNLSACLPVTLAYEGGLSMNRADPGNWTGGKVGRGELRGTNMGIAASAHPNLDIARLTKAEAAAIYQREYWAPAGCENLPAGLDLCHFDGTVNSGRGRSKGWLSAAALGDETVRIHTYSRARLTSLHSFGTWVRFGKGWSARVAGVEAKAVAMTAHPAKAKAILASAGAAAATKAKTTSTLAHTASVVAGAGVMTVPSHSTAGVLVAVFGAAAAVWSHFHASTSGARAAVLAEAAVAA